MATGFFVNSNKEVSKKMPPLLARRYRGTLRSSILAGTKKLAAIKLPLKQLFVLIRQYLWCSTH
jgi:hypothetical protein